MIERVLFAVTREDNRFAMNGALLKLQPEGMTLVATDGHRLALVRKNHPLADVKENREAIIPKKTLQELLRIRSAAEAEKPPAKGDG
jgi:DNA polymerase-3 subunit beta